MQWPILKIVQIIISSFLVYLSGIKIWWSDHESDILQYAGIAIISGVWCTLWTRKEKFDLEAQNYMESFIFLSEIPEKESKDIFTEQ